MEFDKTKVYTALNADEVKPGSKGYFADSIGLLKEAVKNERKANYGKIESISDNEYDACRFIIIDDACYAFFYLVEESKEKKPGLTGILLRCCMTSRTGLTCLVMMTGSRLSG